MGILEVPIILALAAIATYVLAILLRLSCHVCGIEIPTLGRAYLAAGVTHGLSLFAGLLLQTVFVGVEARRIDPLLQFVALVLTLAVHMAISTSLYSLFLSVRFGQAFSVWLVQAIVAIILAIVIGCCGCGVSLLGR